MQVEGIAPWPLEGGAEIIHGEHSLVRQLTTNNKHGVKIHQKESSVINYVFWADTDELLSIEKEGIPQFDKVYNIVEQV